MKLIKVGREEKTWHFVGIEKDTGCPIVSGVKSEYKDGGLIYIHQYRAFSAVTGEWRELGELWTSASRGVSAYSDDDGVPKIGLLGCGAKAGRLLSFQYLLLQTSNRPLPSPRSLSAPISLSAQKTWSALAALCSRSRE